VIYLLLGSVSTYLSTAAGLGSIVLLRPLLDAISPLMPASIALLCTMAALGAALVSAFFALSKPLPLDRDELILLACAGLLGGILGDLISSRFMAMLPRIGVILLQNALLFSLLALAAVYFGTLSRSVRPIGVTRLACVPAAFVISIFASFLAFGAEPVSIAAYYFFFDADDDEAAGAALTIALTAMGGKLVTMLIRLRFAIADARILLWLLPGVLAGAALAALLPTGRRRDHLSQSVLRASLFTCVICMAACFAGRY